MSVYTIPEEVIGIPLFVPPTNDYFQIENGGLPNGDDCLIVNGAVNRDYKAFQAAQSGPGSGIFTSRAGPNWSVSFWFKCSATGTPDTSPSGMQQITNVLFGVQTIAGVVAYSTTDYTFLVVAANQGGLARIGICANTGGGIAYTNVCRDGNWHLIVITCTSTLDCYVDTDASPPAALSSSRSGTVSMTEPYFAIGAYGEHANSRGYGEQWRIGKLMFHDHALTHAERISLVMAMGVAATLPYSGTYYELVVPSMVTSMEVELYGAQGGSISSGTPVIGGKGGYLKSLHTVTPGETIRCYVGQQGKVANGGTIFNGGGISQGSSSSSGMGGGGATDIRRTPFALANRMAVAGAGGGSGAGFPNSQPNKAGGDGGGNGPGANGLPSTISQAGGGGASTSAGGTAGGSGGTWGGTPTAGALGVGGEGGIYHAGGGGAGIYGGGGGPGNNGPGSGGGGSGGVLDGGTVLASSSGNRSGDGLATARWIFP